jgi:hypothetical protein
LLQEYQELAQQRVYAWQISTYAQIVPPILDTLKSITGKTFTTWKDYSKWWDKERDKFEVID